MKSLPQLSPPKSHMHLSHTCHTTHPSHSYSFDHLNGVWWGVSDDDALHYVLSFSLLLLCPCYNQISSLTFYSQTPTTYAPPTMWQIDPLIYCVHNIICRHAMSRVLFIFMLSHSCILYFIETCDQQVQFCKHFKSIYIYIYISLK